MSANNKKNAARLKRHSRSRVRIVGTAQRPRMNIFRSLDNIYVQVIDDTVGRTLVSASTLDKDIASQLEGKNKVDAAKLVGKVAGERAKQAGISQIVFDRGGYRYHGRVAAVAEGAREAGLEF